MKKTLFVLCLMVTMFASCTDGNADVKKCWEFTLTTVSEVSFMGETMDPISQVTTLNECGLTADAAKAKAAELDGVSTANTDGMTVKTTITVTYKEVAE